MAILRIVSNLLGINSVIPATKLAIPYELRLINVSQSIKWLSVVLGLLNNKSGGNGSTVVVLVVVIGIGVVVGSIGFVVLVNLA